MSWIDSDCDRTAWVEARGRGRHAFVEGRALGLGIRLGLALAAWNTLVGGTFGTYDRTRLLLEAVFYVIASVGCSAVSALIEWRYLERTFERGVQMPRPARTER
jgi:hypothetical protein